MEFQIDDSGVNFIYSFFGGPSPQNPSEQIEQLNTPQRVSNTPARVQENVEGNTEHGVKKPTENTEFDQNRFEDLEELMREEEVMQG